MAPSNYPSDTGSLAKKGIMRFVLLAMVGFLPVAALGAFAWFVAADAIRTQTVQNNQASATITSRMVAREFEFRVRSMNAFANLPLVNQAISTRDTQAVRERLQVLVEAHPLIERAFITDTSGVLWADYPVAPESHGKHFSDRDWFAGVSKDWQPYVSEVYLRNASPQVQVVAVVVPVRHRADNTVVGAMVCQVNLERFNGMLRDVEVGEGGYVFLLDQKGKLAAHPNLDITHQSYDDYATSDVVLTGSTTESASLRYVDPYQKEEMQAATVAIDASGSRWLVVAQQPVAIAFKPAHTIAWQVGIAGLLVAGMIAALIAGLSKLQHNLSRVNDQLEGANTSLKGEVAQREQAEKALIVANEGLEQRVAERTRELQKMQEQLLHAQKLEAVGKLAGGVAHDFNNMLSVIQGYGELVLMSMAPDAKYRKEITEICKAGERAAGITRQLLAFSRKQVLQPKLLDVNEAIERTEKMLQRLIGEDIDIEFHRGEGLHQVLFDPGQLEQVLMNLVVNARDAMTGGGKLTIETRNVDLDARYVAEHADARVGPHVMLAVTDTGTGMSPEVRARIFEPFFTTKEMGRGTGLGLSTVYGIVKQCGGNIWVYSERGKGTTFKIYMPRATEGEAPPAQPASTPQQTGGSESILVVEDEPVVRKLVCEVLRTHGYTVLHAPDIDAAIAASDGFPGTVHMLLTDVVLPGKGGKLVAAALVARRPNLKVLFMSGYTDNAIVHHGVLDAGTAFLEKPIQPAKLLAKVREVLDAPPAVS